MLRDQEHNYEIKSLPLGFEVIPRDNARPNVVATVNPGNGFWNIRKVDDKRGWESPLYCFYDVVRNTVTEIYDSWKSPKKDTSYTPIWLYKWLHIQTSKSLNNRIRTEWDRVITTIDPTITDIHKHLFSLSRGKGGWEYAKECIEDGNPYIFSDILRYKAAAASVLYDHSQNWKTDWMLSFSKTGIKYRSLTKTLMNLPNGIIYGMLQNLSNIHLPEPVFSRLKLLAYLCLPDCSFFSDDEHIKKREELIGVIVKSSNTDVKNAVKFMWRYFPPTTLGGFKNTSSIVRCMGLIYDYNGDIGDWDMLGLAKRSEEYHHNQEMQQRIIQEQYQKQSEERRAALAKAKSKLPPIPLPEDKNIRFLDTYSSVVEEGRTMKHCIAQYGEYAIRGLCYLFHVDYKGETASVEVNPAGIVVQSYGTSDTENKASEYGRKKLAIWARGFNQKETPSNNILAYN